MTKPVPAHIAGVKMASLEFFDNHQQLYFAIALWNAEDPTLKQGDNSA